MAAAAAIVFTAGYWAGQVQTVHAQSKRVFELRTYHALEGKLDALNARFRDHTVKLFDKHGITNIGYFTPQDPPLAGKTLIYLLAHPSRQEELRRFPQGSRVDQGPRRLRAERQDRRKGRIGIPRPDRFLGAEVAPFRAISGTGYEIPK
jgi:hypothetical protein